MEHICEVCKEELVNGVYIFVENGVDYCFCPANESNCMRDWLKGVENASILLPPD